jgi:hypothetical protein
VDIDDFIVPAVAEGDPFVAPGANRPEHPCSCLDGFHFFGHLVEGESGEEVEVFELVPCRKCGEEG